MENTSNLKLFLAVSDTSYGTSSTVIAAETEKEARRLAEYCSYIWDGYALYEIAATHRGFIFVHDELLPPSHPITLKATGLAQPEDGREVK